MSIGEHGSTQGYGIISPEMKQRLAGMDQESVTDWLAEVDRLDLEFDMSLMFMQKMYGEDVVSPASEEAQKIAQWGELLDTLKTTDKRFVAFAEMHEDIVPGKFHGSGNPVRAMFGRVIIVNHPNQAKISFDTTGGYPVATIDCAGFEVLEDPIKAHSNYDKFDYTKHLNTIIGGRLEGNEPYDMLQAVVEADSYGGLYVGLKQQLESYWQGVSVAENPIMVYLMRESLLQDSAVHPPVVRNELRDIHRDKMNRM